MGAIDFYQVLELSKLAVISQGIYKRFTLGKTAGPGESSARRRASARKAEGRASREDAASLPRRASRSASQEEGCAPGSEDSARCPVR